MMELLSYREKQVRPAGGTVFQKITAAAVGRPQQSVSLFCRMACLHLSSASQAAHLRGPPPHPSPTPPPRQIKRKPEVLDVLKFIHSAAWPFMFGKAANDLQQANAADDEYMISDHDLLVGETSRVV
jgi:hypothetical protein